MKKLFTQILLLTLSIIQFTNQVINDVITYSCALGYGVSEMNYLTYETAILGCGETIEVKNIAYPTPGSQANLNFDITPPAGTKFRISQISHKKKEDKIFVGILKTDSATNSLLDSLVYFIPDYLNSGTRFLTHKIYSIPNLRGTSDIPLLKVLESVPDNSYFITGDNLGQVFVWDSLLASATPSFSFETCYGKEIVDIKFRSLATQFMVGLSNGRALIHVTSLVADPPIELVHSNVNQVTAIEVFKYSKFVMTGDETGKIIKWDADKKKKKKIYNKKGPYGKEVEDISWVISSNYFVSAHKDQKINIWRVDGSQTFVEGISTSFIPLFVSTIGFDSAFFVGSKTYSIRYDSDSMRCHDYCLTCNGISEYDCTSCFASYELETTGFCKAVCPLAPVYLNLTTNTCESCSEGCQTCIGERDIDCIVCLATHLQHPNRSCHVDCQFKSYFNEPSNNCKRCHPTCGRCTSEKINACTECNEGLMINLDQTCTPKCKPGTFNITDKKCALCHPDCKECNGTEITNCVECRNKSIEFMSNSNKCVDCLNRYDEDLKTCTFTKKSFVARTPYESRDLFSSLSIKIFIEDFYDMRRIVESKLDWGIEYFNVEIEGLEAEEFSKRESIRRGSFILDFNFTKTLDDLKDLNITINKRDWLLVNLTNKDILLIQNLSKIWEGNKINIQLNKKSAIYVESLANNLNYILISLGFIMMILVFLMILMSYDITYLLVDFTRMAKIVHRLKFMSVDQTPLVEFFLSKVYNLYQSGLDQPRDDVDVFQNGYRGKLTEIGVPVFPLVNFSDKYLFYLLSNMVYYSFSQVAKYVAVGDSYKSRRERKLMKVVGKLKIMVILMIYNDLIFSASRNLLHYNLKTFKETNMSIQYYIISIITLCFICYDMISITMNINNNKILKKMEAKVRIVEMNLSEKEEYFKNLEAGKINEDGTKKRSKYEIIEEEEEKEKKEKEEMVQLKRTKTKRYREVMNLDQSSFMGLNDNFEDEDEDEIFEIEEKDKEEQNQNFTNYKELEKENKFSADFEFCAKGIKASKLVVVKKARYFNIILVIKVALFEIIIISNQAIPVVQTSFVFLVQVIFFIYHLLCMFKEKIFKDKFSAYKRIIFEISLTGYYFVCMLQGWCQAGMKSLCTPVFFRRTVFFLLLAVMLILMFVYFLYSAYCTYLRVYYPVLVDKQNRIVLPEEIIKIRWIDDIALNAEKERKRKILKEEWKRKREEQLKNKPDLIVKYWKNRKDLILKKESPLDQEEKATREKLLLINFAEVEEKKERKLKKITEEDHNSFDFSSDEEEEKQFDNGFKWNKDKEIPDDQRLINIIAKTKNNKEESVDDILQEVNEFFLT